MQLVKSSKIILIVLIMSLSLAFCLTSQEETEQKRTQLETLQNDAFAMQLESMREITEFTVRNENISKIERENFYLKAGYLVIIVAYIL